jgi:hypothetical protein
VPGGVARELDRLLVERGNTGRLRAELLNETVFRAWRALLVYIENEPGYEVIEVE